jgi:hypothetical protein
MAWCRDPAHPNPFDADEHPDGNIVELSVSGAGIIAVTHPFLTVGRTVLIAAMGTTDAVVARRIEQDVYPGESYYGVEFADPNSRLAADLQQAFRVRATHAPDRYLPRD